MQWRRRARLLLEEEAVSIDGHDVTQEIRTAEIDQAAATVARHPKVRAVLVQRQRTYLEGGTLVMEGRDIGTNVFPDADVKIYLDASPEERASRRAADPAHRSNKNAVLADVASALEARDHLDRTRQASPLARGARRGVRRHNGRIGRAGHRPRFGDSAGEASLTPRRSLPLRFVIPGVDVVGQAEVVCLREIELRVVDV